MRCDWGFAHSRAPWAERGCVRRTSRSRSKCCDALNYSGATFHSHALRLGLRPPSRSVGGARLCPKDQPQQVQMLRRVELFRRDLPFACAATGDSPTVALRTLQGLARFWIMNEVRPTTR